MAAKPTPREAFHLALFPGLVGYMFQGLGLVNELVPVARERDDAALTRVLGAQGEALKARTKETAALVLALEALEERLGVPLEPRPETPAEHVTWAAAVDAQARVLVAADGLARAAHAAGTALAQAVTNLGVGLMVHFLLAARPDLPLLLARLEGLRRRHDQLRVVWATLAGEAILPVAARAAARRVQELLDAAPALDGGEHAEQVAALQPIVTDLYGQRAALEAALP